MKVRLNNLLRTAACFTALSLAACGGSGGASVPPAISSFTIGGAVSGLNGSVVLQNNGADNHTISVNGPFTFPTAVAYGSPYNISILTQPLLQTCSVSAGSGSVTGNVSSVGVTCSATPPVSGTVTTVAGMSRSYADGTGAAARLLAPMGAGTVVGGKFYVADTGNHVIRKIDIATGAVTILAGQIGVAGAADGIGAAASFNQPYGIASDGTDLYVTDMFSSTIRKITLATGAVTTLAGQTGVQGSADGTGTAATFNRPQGLAADSTNLYVSDTNNHTIRKIVIATGVVTTLAGTVGMPDNIDGTGTAAMLASPRGITVDGGNLYVTNTSTHTIRKIVIATGVVTTVAGQINLVGSSDATGTAASFNTPCGISSDGTNLYVTDTNNHTLRQIVIATGAVTTLAGQAGTLGFADGTGTAASFAMPRGITANGGNLYVSDMSNNTIRKVVAATGVVSTLAGTAPGVDGSGTAATFAAFVEHIASDGTNLYVADAGNHTIRKIVIATGQVSTLAGKSGVAGLSNGTGVAAGFNYPIGIATDGSNLYVTDSSNNTIRKIVISTGVVTTLAGSGSPGSADGTGAGASFNTPTGIVIAGGNLYVTDTLGFTIRKIDIATGAVTTLAGQAFVSGAADGTGVAATFNQPYDLTSDGTNLYVADMSNHTIRKIVIATGAVTTLAGTAGTAGSADGSGTAATFSSPQSLTYDGTDLYVADSANATIRKIALATGAVTTLAGQAGVKGWADGTGAAATFTYPTGITSVGSYLYVMDAKDYGSVRKIVK